MGADQLTIYGALVVSEACIANAICNKLNPNPSFPMSLSQCTHSGHEKASLSCGIQEANQPIRTDCCFQGNWGPI